MSRTIALERRRQRIGEGRGIDRDAQPREGLRVAGQGHLLRHPHAAGVGVGLARGQVRIGGRRHRRGRVDRGGDRGRRDLDLGAGAAARDHDHDHQRGDHETDCGGDLLHAPG
ncbi:MAG: hypothetical protein IPL61_18215 [Myxococcales bacterium]|nr:hypothetical protein [Myxococcales bacterium]